VAGPVGLADRRQLAPQLLIARDNVAPIEDPFNPLQPPLAEPGAQRGILGKAQIGG
jgi:hypothetical protein